MFVSNRTQNYYQYYLSKLILPEDIEKKVIELKKNHTIATLNGSFDLIHAGHLEMIYQASLQADLLIVALNSDASIKAYKSPLRPIIPLEYRMQMMAALSMVDYVTYFEETDPIQLLDKIGPHVHVNGSEYGQDCIEADIVKKRGGRVHIVDLIPGLSTSSIINKIKTVC
ncbi:MAG: adenylyltransferase/cytidyltransferase family protein [Rhabdochlamydiaceae bacterium]